MKKQDYCDRRVWITGASTGIGEAIAREMSQRGARVALSARSGARLAELVAELGPEKTLAVPLDVTDRDANHRAVATIREAWGGLDVALLNAGTCEYVDVQAFDATLFERTYRINLMGMVYGIEAALPELRRSKTPSLVGMSSTVAYAGLPRSEAYGSSKAAIRHLMESLRIDLYREGIHVAVICPGFVRTPLTDKNDFPMPMRVEADYAGRVIADGILRRRNEIHFPKSFSIPFKMLALLPASLWTLLGQRLIRPTSNPVEARKP